MARAKLGLSPPGLVRVCACNKSFDAAEDSLHALSCGLNKGFRNIRHDSIRNKLYQLIKRLNPGIPQTHLSLEWVKSTPVTATHVVLALTSSMLRVRIPSSLTLSSPTLLHRRTKWLPPSPT